MDVNIQNIVWLCKNNKKKNGKLEIMWIAIWEDIFYNKTRKSSSAKFRGWSIEEQTERERSLVL